MGAEQALEWGLMDAINICATALHQPRIYMDADQALVCRDTQEGRSARKQFVRDA